MMPYLKKAHWKVVLATTLLCLGSGAGANTVSGNANTTATLTVDNDWGSGYCASVSITNNGVSAVTDWQVTLQTNDSAVNNLWNGALGGNTVTPKGYNSEIGVAGSTSFGFCANANGTDYIAELTALSVNGSSSSSTSSVSSSSSSSSSSSVDSSSSSSSSSLSSVSSSSSSSSAGEVIPNAASNGYPYCRSEDSDPDGDGWGWENNYSCIVYASSADPGAGDYPHCLIGEQQITLCSTDNGSWNSEGGEVCLSESLCPGMTDNSQSPMQDTPVNPDATAATREVYTYLTSIWGNHMLSGQMDLTWQDATDQYQRVINDTGRAPAMMGYDFMNYGLYWNGISGLNQTGEALEHWNRGGLVSFMWHWRNPNAPEGEIGEFYTEDTDFTIPITGGQLDTTSVSFANIQEDVDRIAAELQTLEDAGVPVLWRPLHEASGGWFWWGRADRTDGVPPAYAQVVLWRYLYERLTHHHGLDNLIWVWNGQNAAWYPGDDVVDIVSHDIYDGEQNYESQVDLYELTKSFPHETKMVALSENSNIPDPDLMAEDNAWWLWFMVWNDTDTAEGVSDSSNFWTGEYYNTDAHKTHVYNHELVITLDELPDFE